MIEGVRLRDGGGGDFMVLAVISTSSLLMARLEDETMKVFQGSR